MNNITHFNDLPRDPILCILKFLDHKDLANVRAINKKFKKIADTPTLYSQEILKIKETFEEYNRLVVEIEKHVRLKTKDVDLKILRRRAEILNKECLTLNKEKKRKEAFQKMMSIFGGKEGYEALPVIRHGEYIYYPLDGVHTIPASAMTAPIMRGENCYKRNFFSIRYRADNKIYSQTFFEGQYNKDSWTDSTYKCPLINCNDYIIDKGKVNEEIFSQLKDAIKAKGTQFYAIE